MIISAMEWPIIRPIHPLHRGPDHERHALTRVALVTGASRGIGAAVARRLARDGFSVAVNYASSGAEADALVAELRAGGAAALAVRADIGRADDVRRMFDAVERQLGRVDVLVNNAGILKTGPLADATDDAFDRIFDINVRGTFNTLREAAKRLADGGRIINFEHDARAEAARLRALQRDEGRGRGARTCSRRNCADGG